MAVAYSALMPAGPPLSRAGSLPHGIRGRTQHLHTPPNPVGAGLARDDGGIFSIDVCRPTAIASRLAPIWDPGRTQHLHTPPNPVGAGLARDGGGTFSIDASRPTAIASRLALTWDPGEHNTCIRHRILWEPGLPAMVVAHSALMPAGPPLSRAGSLPPWLVEVHDIGETPRPPVGASLLAMTSAQPTSPLADRPPGVQIRR